MSGSIRTTLASATVPYWANVPRMANPPKSSPSWWRRKPPAGSAPVTAFRPRSHRFWWPVEQKRQRPHEGMNAHTTWSPGSTRVTPGPTASITPEPSWPPTSGKRGSMSPVWQCWSEWHSPATSKRISTSPSRGGSSSSSVTSQSWWGPRSTAALVLIAPPPPPVGPSAPHRPGHAGHQQQLLQLLLPRDVVPLHRRGEAALGAERQPVQRHVPRGLIHARLQLVLRLHARLLGRDQAQHDRAVLGHVAERAEPTRALVVVLQQEALEQRLLEDPGDRLIVALRIELALVVAAADVQAERDPGVALDDRVVELDAAVDQLLRVAAALPVALAHLRVEQRRVLGRVDLDVRAAEPDQLVHLAPGHVHDVGQVLVPARLRAL